MLTPLPEPALPFNYEVSEPLADWRERVFHRSFHLRPAEPAAPRPEILQFTGDTTGVNEPAITKEGDIYYLYCTGGGRGGQGIIPIRTSKDLHVWTLIGYVLDKLAEWAATEIPRARGAWAPDISFFRGKYHLYYAVSTFGSRNSAIGLLTNETLDPKSLNYKWVDEGMFFGLIRAGTTGMPLIRKSSLRTRMISGWTGQLLARH